MRYIYGDNIGGVKLIQKMGYDSTPAHAARASFGNISNAEEVTLKDQGLIEYLAINKHTSPCEHLSATFILKVPLFARSQIMRHRTFSFNEISRRYTSQNLQYYLPISIKEQASKNLQCSSSQDVTNIEAIKEKFAALVEVCNFEYQEFLNLGVARETARMILPQNTYTSFWMTGNLLNWSKFLKIRCQSDVQLETRLAALEIKEALLDEYPVSLGSLLNE